MTAAVDRNYPSKVSARFALLGGAACLIGLLVTGVAVRTSGAIQWRDIVVLHDFMRLATPRTAPLENTIAQIADTTPAMLIGIGIAGIALARRRARLALLVAVVCIGASMSTELIKAALPVQRYSPLLAPGEVSAHSWPSGHSTAIMALMLCLVIVVPRRLRPAAAAVGACVALGVSFSLLALRWHFPSDVIGGYLMAGTWTCFGVAALRFLDNRVPKVAQRRARASNASSAVRARDAGRLRPALAKLCETLGYLSRTGGVIAVVAVALVALLVFTARASQALSFASAHPLMIAAACLIAALAVGLSSMLTLALRQ